MGEWRGEGGIHVVGIRKGSGYGFNRFLFFSNLVLGGGGCGGNGRELDTGMDGWVALDCRGVGNTNNEKRGADTHIGH